MTPENLFGVLTLFAFLISLPAALIAAGLQWLAPRIASSAPVRRLLGAGGRLARERGRARIPEDAHGRGQRGRARGERAHVAASRREEGDAAEGLEVVQQQTGVLILVPRSAREGQPEETAAVRTGRCVFARS